MNFYAHLVNYDLKCCIEEKKLKNNISRKKDSVQNDIRLLSQILESSPSRHASAVYPRLTTEIIRRGSAIPLNG